MKVAMRGARERIQIPGGHSFRVLRWSRTLREVECVLAPAKAERVAGEGTHWHYHPEMELTLFTSGTGTRFVGDHMGPFAAGDLVLLGERLPHYWHTRAHSSGVSIQWHFPQTHPFWAFPETLPFMDLFKRAGRGLHFTGPTCREAAALLQEITRVSGAAQLALLLRLFTTLHAAPPGDRSLLSVRSFSLSPESHYQEAIARSIRHLIAHFRDPVRLDDLLKLTGLSRPTFARQFKQHAGRTCSEFLNRLRLHAACRELTHSRRSILEIALATGFSQISFFNRLFRRTYHCSPSEYREKGNAPQPA